MTTSKDYLWNLRDANTLDKHQKDHIKNKT